MTRKASTSLSGFILDTKKLPNQSNYRLILDSGTLIRIVPTEPS